MFRRIIEIPLSNSFFLFGPRGTGKSTWIEHQLSQYAPLMVNLLLPKELDRYSKDPELLIREISQLRTSERWVVVDEVQRVPSLLDVVHHQIESTKVKFALTGSSARKLRRGAANLLAGRAFSFALHPLTHIELDNTFQLDQILRFGSLPKIFQFQSDHEKELFLESYALTYLQEEVWNEHLIRKLPPFQRFLEIAAQMNGEIVNYSKIASDVGVDDKTVREYFLILTDTLVAFLVNPYHRSIRKQQRAAPKFYFFDCGVKRAIENSVFFPIRQGSSEYGKAFEHFIIAEFFRLNSYRKFNAQFSYLRTKDDAEIDLIIERRGQATVLLEIKSTSRITVKDTQTLQAFLPHFSKAKGYVFSRDPKPQRFGSITALPWEQGFQEIGFV